MREYVRTADQPPGEILRALRQYYEWDGTYEGWCVRHKYSGPRVRDWTIRLRGYELRTLDMGHYLQSYEWRWNRTPIIATMRRRRSSDSDKPYRPHTSRAHRDHPQRVDLLRGVGF